VEAGKIGSALVYAFWGTGREYLLRVYSVEKLVSRFSWSNFGGLQTINWFVCVALRAFYRVDFFDDTQPRYWKRVFQQNRSIAGVERWLPVEGKAGHFWELAVPLA